MMHDTRADSNELRLLDLRVGATASSSAALRREQMRIFVAGATGAIGKPLLPLLIERGYDVYGMTKSPDKVEALERQGTHAVVADAFDAQALRNHIAAITPDVIIHLLTDLPFGTPPALMKEGGARNARMRSEGTSNLVDAALEAGVGRMIAAGIAWVYAAGHEPHSEDDPVNVDAPEPTRTTMRGVVEMERRVLHSPGLSGAVLRNGLLYGPGTGHDSRDGDISVHVDAAARATLLAVERNAAGIFNVVNDNAHVSNAKARSVLGWSPDAR